MLSKNPNSPFRRGDFKTELLLVLMEDWGTAQTTIIVILSTVDD